MFTGIIEEIGTITRIVGTDMTVRAAKVRDGLAVGDSVAVNGACLTAATLLDDAFVLQMSPETFQRTTLGTLRSGAKVNLERAMTLGGRLGGHLVLGHVDGVGRVLSVEKQGEFTRWRFGAPEEVSKYLVPKGSIAVDGISLTVIEPGNDSFAVAIIPTTLAHTTLGTKGPGDSVNLESDIIGRHVYHYLHQAAGNSSSGITAEYLAEHGFL